MCIRIPTPISRRECLAHQLWTAAFLRQRWAVHTLLLRWVGRPPFDVDVQQRVAIDLTRPLTPSTLARYRCLVTHEDTLTPDEQRIARVTACAVRYRTFPRLEAPTMDYDKWTTADLRRYYTLLAHVLDAEVFPECALSDTEARELERFRLGIAERIEDHPTPRRVHDEHFPITERAFVEQEVAHRTSRHSPLDPRLTRPISSPSPSCGSCHPHPLQPHRVRSDHPHRR